MAEQTGPKKDCVSKPEKLQSDWRRQFGCQIVSANDPGTGGDHRLKVENGIVSCDGLKDDEATKFTLYSIVPRNENEEFTYVMLECSGGGCRNYMVCLADDQVYSRQRKQIYLSLAQAEREKDVVFKRRLNPVNNEEYTFESNYYKGQYLGFDPSGQVIKPSEVNEQEPEGLFYITCFPTGAAQGVVDQLQA